VSVGRRLCIVDRVREDRWLPGDRFLRAPLRRLLRGPRRPSGLDRVRINLLRGLDEIGVRHVLNPSFRSIRPDDAVCVLGRGRDSLTGYDRPNRIVAGIGLMTHPSEWPSLCEDYPVVRYLQHSEWTRQVYEPFFGDRCEVWPVGIDTRYWCPSPSSEKRVDFLIYDKIRWERDTLVPALLEPVRRALKERGQSVQEIRYGHYDPERYREALRRCRAMVFLSEHESQGIACQEALSSGVPVLAWDQGTCLDPDRFGWGVPDIPVTSVPYFDERCGERFTGPDGFPAALQCFVDGMRESRYAPRDYILEHLTLARSARRFVEIVERAYAS
jgi:glycosyltransferase involved in cell wall biosynthesis